MLPFHRGKTRTYAKGNYNKSTHYLSKDSVQYPNSGWGSNEIVGEYKYIIYYFAATNVDDKTCNVNNSKNKDGKFVFTDNQGTEIYSNGELAEEIRKQIDAFNNYGFGFTFNYCGWEEISQAKWDELKKLYPELINSNGNFDINSMSDMYAVAEVDGNKNRLLYTKGKDKNGNAFSPNKTYSDHHFSIIIVGGVRTPFSSYYYVTSSTNILGSIHLYLTNFKKSTMVQHETLHSLGFEHVGELTKNNASKIGNQTATYSPFSTGTFLNSELFSSQLEFVEDAINGIDIVYQVPEKNYHLTIKGDVESTGYLTNEDATKRDNGWYGLSTDIEVKRNSSGVKQRDSSQHYITDGYLGMSYIFLVEDDTNELFYQSPVDKNGYFEFKIRIPSRYINVVTGRNFSLFFVSSHFYINWLAHKNIKIPIFWHRTSSIRIPSSVSLPYTFDLTNDNIPGTTTPYGKIKVKNTTFASYFEVNSNNILTSTDLYTNLEKQSGIRIIWF